MEARGLASFQRLLSTTKMSTPSSSVLLKKCPGCDAAFAKQKMLNGHVEQFRHHLHCLPCGRKFTTQDARNAHYKDSKAHPNCTQCDIGFEHHNALDIHKRQIHGGSYNVSQGISRSLSPASSSIYQIPEPRLNNLVIPPPVSEPYTHHCPICGLDFNNAEAYAQHRISDHSECYCDTCSTSFASLSEWSMHFHRPPGCVAKDDAAHDNVSLASDHPQGTTNSLIKNVEISVLSVHQAEIAALSSDHNPVPQESELSPKVMASSSYPGIVESPLPRPAEIITSELSLATPPAASQPDNPEDIAVHQTTRSPSRSPFACASPVPAPFSENNVLKASEPIKADAQSGTQVLSSSASPIVQPWSSPDHIVSGNIARNPNSSSSPQAVSSYESVTRISASSYTIDTKASRRKSKTAERGRSRSSQAATDVRYPFTCRSRPQTPVPRCWDAESAADPVSTPRYVSHIYCRSCRVDPCVDVTATMCGHIFCNKCITEAVIKSSQCPACRAPILLYSLFKLYI